MTDLTGLVMVANDAAWAWAGSRWRQVSPGSLKRFRVERWRAVCTSCGKDVAVLASVPREVFLKFLEKRRAGEAEVRVRIKATGPLERFTSNRCRECMT